MQQTKKSDQKTYSFSKAKRFCQPYLNYITANYNINRSLNNRAYSIGKGKRSDFTKSFSNAPAPTQYLISSIFQNQKTKGVTFGISRDKAKELGYITQSIQRNPGVGNYNCSYQIDPKIQYTLRPKTQSNWLPSISLNNLDFLYEQAQLSQRNVPGPGQYNYSDIDQMGQTQHSRFKSTKCYKIGKEERFKRMSIYFNKKGYSSPGPSAYQAPDDLNDSGLYYESKHKGTGKRIISKEPRKSFIDDILLRQNKDQSALNSSDRINSQLKGYDSEF